MAERSAPVPVCYGLDIGGTKIELVAYDASMQVRHRRLIGTPTHDYADLLQAVSELVQTTDAELGSVCQVVGLGMPGVRDRTTGRQLSSNVPALTGQQVV
jgi:N-acetylglucosamine kinase